MNSNIPGVEEVKHIASIKDSVIRNLQITQCYHELSKAVAEKIGNNANWCTFATWASKQAGQTIRKEDLFRAIESVISIKQSTEQSIIKIVESALRIGVKQSYESIRESIWNTLNVTAINRASDSVAKGNKKVFEEIGYEFARFITTCLHDESYNADNIHKFCNELKPGLPPDGQQYLHQAFTRYYQSLFEEDNKKKMELILLANLEIGFHEQTRLQPEIADSLNAALAETKEFRNNLIDKIFPSQSWLNRIRVFFLWLFGRLSKFDSEIESFINSAQHSLRLIITEHLMTISIPPDLRINLGKDLTAGFPAGLESLENSDLKLMLEKVDPTPNSLLESGAVDWADLPDRIHFICDMFRCYHLSPNLFEEPFNPEQVVAIKTGIVPVGSL